MMDRPLSLNGRRRRVLLTILTGCLLGVGFPSGADQRLSMVAAADGNSDIPGVALPGPIAAGRLGGAIYDVVYRIDVPPGHVVVASLTGTAGTDFDVYLFDSTATTVLSDVGLLKKSAGPTSSESISWPSTFGGTYYLDLNGATDVEGDYRVTVQTVPDSTPPTVSTVLADGRGSINQLVVPVTLHALDNLSGIADMAFSEDGSAWSPWAPFEPTTTWTFSAGPGVRTLWTKVRNGVGLESVPVSDTVVIDLVAPSVVALAPTPGSSVVGLRPPFTVVLDEPIDPSTWTDFGLIVQSATGTLIPGRYSYDPLTRAGAFVPGLDLQPGGTYVVTLGAIRDIAGNRIAQTGSWTVTPLAPVNLDARISQGAVALGSSVSVDLTLSGAPLPAAVQIDERLAGADGFVPRSELELANGRLSFELTPALNTTYRLTYAGAFGVASAQVDVPVLVRRSIRIVGRSDTIVARSRVGTAVNLVSAVSPGVAGLSVSFRVYRYDTTRRVWVYAGSRGRSTDTTGRATYTWTPPSVGSWYVRVAIASTVDFANNVSPVYRWTIRR